MFRKTFVFVLLLGAAAQCQQRADNRAEVDQAETSAPASVSSGLDAPSPDLPIGPGDLLSVTVFDVPELSVTLRVSNSGEINYPLLGQLKIAGVTTAAAEQMIRGELDEKHYVLNPQVQVFIREYATQAVSVLGQVRSPGAYRLLGSHTLLDVISAAGGLTPSAGTTITITRAGSTEPIIVNLHTTPGQSWKNNPVVFAGDRVEVHNAPIVYVIGDVRRPGGFLVHDAEKLTVIKVIALAEGPNRSAALNRVMLLRKTPAGVQETRLSVKRMLAGKTKDVELQGDDILYVPNSAAKSFATQTAQSLFGAVSRAVYAPW